MKEQIKEFLGKAKDKIIEKSPEILIGIGIVGSIGATILACKATLKNDEILKKNKAVRDIADENIKKLPRSEYSLEDYKKDKLIISANTVKDIALNYLPAVTVGIASIASILCGYNILSKRTVAIMTAYNALEKSFMSYRQRVIDDQGREKDMEYMSGVKAVKVTKKDKNGKTKKETKIKTTFGRTISPYARWYTEPISYERFKEIIKDKPNLYPEGTKNSDYILYAGTSLFSSREYNRYTLAAQEQNANDLLMSRASTTRRVFLNEVYEMLGFEPTIAGQHVGWSLDSKYGDHYISFGLDKFPEDLGYIKGSILLDFNVDGEVLDSEENTAMAEI